MTNASRILLISIALFVLGAVGPGVILAKGPPVREIIVEQATPDFAELGETGKPIVLTGSNFPDYAKIKFIYNTTQNEGEVIVVQQVVQASSKSELNFDIDVALDADLGAYDILVEETDAIGILSGRKGKGTTLFKVQSSKNAIVSCLDEFFPLPRDSNIRCDCEFTAPGENWPHYGMLRDCHTSATLKLQTYPIVNPSSSTPDGIEMATLTAVLGNNGTPFQGSSVISNTTDKAGVRFLNIRFAPGVARGCNQELQSAISFVLDEDTDNPDRNSALNVADVTIDTNDPDGNADNDPLCTAIEIRRETAVETVGNLDGAQGYVDNVTIAEGSYEQFGINYEGMQPSGSFTKQVFGNYIGAPDCDHEPDTAAIQISNVILTDPFDPSSQNPVVAESNIIHMENSGCPEPGPVGVGIRVDGEEPNSLRIPEGAELLQSTAEIVKNVISGAMVGVEVDENVLNVHFSGNTLIGDPDLDDFGICSDADNTSTKGKPNIWSGYVDEDHEIRYSPCP